MFVLLGAMCVMSKINCTTVGMIGQPYKTKVACEQAKAQMNKLIGPVEWLDGTFQCVEDEAI
jgi:hypothetical protein